MRAASTRMTLAGCIAALLGWAGAAQGQPVITERTVFYDIEGGRIAELRDELVAKGPLGRDARRVHGLTRSDVSWEVSFQPTDGGCRIGSHSIRLEVEITLPRWTGRAMAWPRDAVHWDGYIAALTRHEAGHRDIAVASVQALHALLSGFGAQHDCRALSREVDRQAGRLMHRAELDSARYDERTGHGATQGAAL